MKKNNILEISKRVTKSGRVPITIVLHKIHTDEKETNKNGLHWKEDYTKQNMQSAVEMPICAEFADDEKSTPLGHGLTDQIVGVDGKTQPIFENSETVGVINSVSVETVHVNNEDILALVGKGFLYYQRYPKFVDFVRTNFALDQVLTSIEIMGLPENDNNIIYEEDEPTQEFRTPKIYDYSGVCILGVEPADDNAIVLEVAQKTVTHEKNNKEEEKMEFNDELKIAISNAVTNSFSEMNNKENEFNSKLEEVNSQLEAKDSIIAQKDVELNEKEAKISELNATIEQLQSTLDQLNKDHETYWAERELLEKELVQAKVEKKLGELTTSLEVFSDDEKKLCEDEINACKDEIEKCEKTEELNDVSSEINSIVNHIYAEIGKASKKAEHDAIVSEQNSKKEEINVEDIFSEVCTDNKENDDEEDVNIF